MDKKTHSPTDEAAAVSNQNADSPTKLAEAQPQDPPSTAPPDNRVPDSINRVLKTPEHTLNTDNVQPVGGDQRVPENEVIGKAAVIEQGSPSTEQPSDVEAEVDPSKEASPECDQLAMVSVRERSLYTFLVTVTLVRLSKSL